MKYSDSVVALNHFRKMASKWRNISLLLAIFAFILIVSTFVPNDSIESDGDYIAKIKIDGIIFEDDFRSEVLEKIADKSSVKGVIVQINSPGGGIVGSEILYKNLRKIAEKKPTVILMESVAASGGYMAAIASDYIIAYNGTLTGSIGVLLESPEVTELAKKVGISFKTYKSSPLKGTPSPFEKPSELTNRVIQESIADSHNFFKELVIARRGEKIKKTNYRKVFDGRIFTGRQALELGLVDQIGGMNEAITQLKQNKELKDLSIKKVELVKSEKKFLKKILGSVSNIFSQETNFSSGHIMAIMP